MTISITELSALEQAMTPGEWVYGDQSGDIVSPSAGINQYLPKPICQMYYADAATNAAGICAMRNAMPVLLEIAGAALAWDRATAAANEALRVQGAAQITYHSCGDADRLLALRVAWGQAIESVSRAVAAVDDSERVLREALEKVTP